MSRSPVSFKFFLMTGLALVLISAGCSDDRSVRPEPEKRGRELDYTARIIFQDSDGQEVATLRAAVAEDDVSRSTGLMEVYDMPADAGMLFIFPDEEPRSFWMANTPLPLDIIFVNARREIVRIHPDARPFTDRNILSHSPAMYVVEAHAGYAMQHDILEGMTIRIERNGE